MSVRLHASRCLVAALCLPAAAAGARTWTDATGRYTLEADLVAFDGDRVILQREDKHLGEIARDKLSEEDRKYLESKEAEESSDKVLNGEQLWTMAGGLQIEARIVDFFSRDITVQRRRGKLYVNDRRYDNLPEIYQQILNRVVEHFEDVQIKQRTDLNRWVAKQNHKPRTFHCEGVVLELDNGDEYGVPFFLFSEKDLELLQPGFEAWKRTQEDYEERQNAAMRLQALAAARQRHEQIDRQVAQLQLGMQAVAAGVTSLWEVTLYPGRGTPGPPIWAVYPGRDSRTAVNQALAKNPGYIVGPVRKVSY